MLANHQAKGSRWVYERVRSKMKKLELVGLGGRLPTRTGLFSEVNSRYYSVYIRVNAIERL